MGVSTDGLESGRIHDLLFRSWKGSPDHEAVVDRDKSWTYDTLLNVSKTYAVEMRRAGLKKGQRVVLDASPCCEAIALFFACSMLGLVYVPTDPSAPDARVLAIIVRTDASLYIGNRKLPPSQAPLPVVGRFERDSLCIEKPLQTLEAVDEDGPPLPTDLAYIIFTSGTTGEPKGIMMTHGAVIAVFQGLVHHCRLQQSDRVGTISPLQFDFSILDIGLALTTGATLIQVPAILAHHPKAFVNYLKEKRITQMNGVPSIWRALLRDAPESMGELSGLKTIFYAGEGFSYAEIASLRKARPQLRVINAFGHSESILCTMRDVEPFADLLSFQPPIGFGFPGMEMLLLNDSGTEVTRPGERGELYIGGPCLFSGYWKDTTATERALIPHPKRPLTGGRMFRSGDIIRIGEDHEFYFAGRRDLQIKIRGNRVEIEEVESCLRDHPAITAAAVIVEPDDRGEPARLVAFVVTDREHRFSVEQIRGFCADRLPHYMVPGAIIQRDMMPTTTNGKTDRASLNTDVMKAREHHDTRAI